MIKILIGDVLKYFDEEIADVSLAEDFDNVGLLVGDENLKVENVMVSLDVTKNVVKMAKREKVNLIISHHPIIFNPIKRIDFNSLIYEIIKNDISIISMHTNFDRSSFGVSFCLAKALLLDDIEILKDSMEFGRVGNLKKPITFDYFLEYVSKKLNTPVKGVKTTRLIKRVAVVSGSGGFALNAAIKSKADALVTGDVKHNLLLEAFDKDFCVVDASHFATERVFCLPLVENLSKRFSNLGVKFIVASEEDPCIYYSK